MAGANARPRHFWKHGRNLPAISVVMSVFNGQTFLAKAWKVGSVKPFGILNL